MLDSLAREVVIGKRVTWTQCHLRRVPLVMRMAFIGWERKGSLDGVFVAWQQKHFFLIESKSSLVKVGSFYWKFEEQELKGKFHEFGLWKE